MADSNHTFLITGASSGFGLAVAAEALARGHRVIGCSRDISKAAQQYTDFKEAGGFWMQLDVTDPNTQTLVAEAVEKYNVDVLVSNAGYGLYGALEDMSDQEIRGQFDTNFFGSVAVIKGAIPYFRRKRRGMIVAMSSISGFTVTSPSGLMYSATKFALEAVIEGLALQLSPFSIRTYIVEPGLFRTNWLSKSYATPAAGLTDDYEGGPVGNALKSYPTIDGAQEGDPSKAAKIILDVIASGIGSADHCLRLPLGNDGIDKAWEKVDRLTENFRAVEKLSRQTSFQDQRKD